MARLRGSLPVGEEGEEEDETEADGSECDDASASTAAPPVGEKGE